MADWRPIETAPKDVPILVYYDHEADPYRDPENPDKLTTYAAHAEGGDFLDGKGIAIARWSEGWWESEGWESTTSDYWMPAVWSAWFDGDFADHVVNPLFWRPLPEPPTTPLSEREKPPSEGRLGSACGAVASAVFYHIADHQHREKLAFALVDLAQEIRRGIELGKAGEA